MEDAADGIDPDPTLNGLGWFQVTELRGLIQDGEISEYQVTLTVGFRLLDSEELEAAVACSSECHSVRALTSVRSV